MFLGEVIGDARGDAGCAATSSYRVNVLLFTLTFFAVVLLQAALPQHWSVVDMTDRWRIAATPPKCHSCAI